MYERNINQLPLTCPQLGIWPTTQVCALTRNQTSELLVYRSTPNLLSHTSQAVRTRIVLREPFHAPELIFMTITLPSMEASVLSL